MRLADDDVDEVDAVAPTGIELFERLHGAYGDRSGRRAEVEQDRASVNYRGTAVPYVYPTKLLEDLMDKIYVSPGVEVYR